MEKLYNWIEDIPWQFRDKPKFKALISALDKQVEELMQVFSDINEKTTVENAVGVNLDLIGKEIVGVTRADAKVILKDSIDTEVNDDMYRKIIQYQIYKNTCECTYSDVMECIRMLWDTDDIKYVEDPEHPATIYIELPTVDIDGMDPSVGRVLCICPGGVLIAYAVGYYISVYSHYESANLSIALRIPIDEPIPEYEVGVILRTSIEENMSVESDTVTILENAWRLNGEYYLNGEKLLDAEEREEEL